MPTIDALHGLVNRFGKNVDWLGERDAWKTRFTLACGTEHLWAAMENYFGAGPSCSRRIGGMLRRIRKDAVAVDDGRVLADSYTFFAARLLQRRLQEEGKWTSQVMRFVPARGGRSFGKRTSEEAIEKYRRLVKWRMNPGNWFLRLIEREIAAEGCHGSLHERIMSIGVRELNRILDSKRGRREVARQP